MLLKFTKEKDITDYLIYQGLIKYDLQGIKRINYSFNDKYFINPDELVQYLIEIQLVSKICIPELTWEKGIKVIKYKFEYYTINNNHLESIKSNLVINSDINYNRLLSINECCKILSITRPTLYKMIQNNLFPYYRINEQFKVKYSDLMDYIDSNKV